MAAILSATAVAGHAKDNDGGRASGSGQGHMMLERQILEEVTEGCLRNAVVGMFAMTAAGDTIVDYNSSVAMVPASNMKLVTTGCALHSLGQDYRYKTALGYSGKIRDGILEGDLYIIGGADPTLGAEDSIATPLAQTFRQWRQFIADAGISRINGYIVGDDRFFDRVMEEETWLWNDLGTYYGTGTSGLSFYENRQDFRVRAGDRPGEPIQIEPGFPYAPWMEYRYSCTTGPAGTGNKLYYYTSGLAPVGEMRGTFAVDRAPKTEEGSNKFPAYTCAWHFAKYLRECGVACGMGAADLGETFGLPLERVCSRDSLTIIGAVSSPELRRIIFETNHESNNFYAETIFRTLGRKYCGTGTYEDGRTAVNTVLRQLGVADGGVRIRDGSGLSRQNYISPGFLCGFLRAMLGSPAADSFIGSLPSPGDNGTLEYMMSGYPAATRSRIYVKSGSMDGTLCYSGYVMPQNGDNTGDNVIIFSIMTNNCTATPYRMRKSLERLLWLVATEIR